MSDELVEIVGYEGLYSITDDGRIWGHKRKGWLKPSNDNRGYLQVVLFKNGKDKCHKVHGLVGKALIPNSLNKPEINHKDGNKLNNHVSNLEYVTHQENIDHAWKMGSFDNRNISGEKNGSAKLVWDQVREIRNNHKYRKRGEKTWEKYNICKVMYYRIISRKNWKRC